MSRKKFSFFETTLPHSDPNRFFETLSNQAVVLAAQTRFYLAQMLAQKGEAARSRSLHTEIIDQFQDWDISIWQQKCEQALVAIKDLPFSISLCPFTKI